MLVFGKICVRTKCMIPIALIQPQMRILLEELT